ncbi:ribbon-helix-helix domain-containing protein [Tolypothrix sp. VBCCA 56010]|uniref:ribbon-helix-helix domain-containing protein n=1 Tax=Tolypothrix sp. VBCCA 56010 TaxID=3137731 RepID=UPI003D7CBC82
MPNQRAKDRPRVQFVCDQKLADDLQGWADSENRSRSNLIETLLFEVVSERERSSDPHGLPTSELIDQLKKFLQLLTGDRERNGISYVLLGQTLGIDPEKLHELYVLVEECRAKQPGIREAKS